MPCVRLELYLSDEQIRLAKEITAARKVKIPSYDLTWREWMEGAALVAIKDGIERFKAETHGNSEAKEPTP